MLVGHGSREAAGNQQFYEFVDAVRQAAPERLIESCFIELAEPDVPTGLTACVERGASEVVVVPLTLLAAGHAKLEVPEHIAEARRQHRKVQFHYGRHLGIHPLVLDILAQRLQELEAAAPPLERSQCWLLVVGRGSSDPDANGDLFKAARLAWEGRGFGGLEVGFSGVTTPSFTDAIHRCVRLGARRVYILPYFLFTGVLIQRMQRQTQELQAQYPEVELCFGGHFGAHPKLVELVFEREQEAVLGLAQMNCDLCKYKVPLVGFERDFGRFVMDHDHNHNHASPRRGRAARNNSSDLPPR